MAEEIIRYDYIRLEPAKNGFMLSYSCVRENEMKPRSEFECCEMSKHETEVFDDSENWEDAFDRATAKMKELYLFNQKNKKKNPEY